MTHKSLTPNIKCEVKVGFFQKMKTKFSNLSNRHASEPKIVSELLFPVSISNTFMGNILNTCN